MGLVMASIATVAVLLVIFVLLNRKFPVARSGLGSSGQQGPSQPVSAAHVEREDPGVVHDDMRQMLEAQNALRRQRGADEMSEDDLRSAVAEDERHRSRGRGPFGGA